MNKKKTRRILNTPKERLASTIEFFNLRLGETR